MSDVRKSEDGVRSEGSSYAAPDPAATVAAGDGATESTIRVEGLAAAFEVRLSSESLGADLFKLQSQTDSERASQVFDEVADDMLELMKRLAALDAKVGALGDELTRLKQTVADASRMQAHEIDKLKEVLLSDRKELIARSTFNVLRPAIESFQYLREAYQKLPEDGGAVRQAETMLDLLSGIVQMLGYQAFSVAHGEEFDPHRMDCAGYAEGEPGRVVKVERPGYKAGSLMVRPCAVVLGRTDPDGS